ncbi:penicillin acylase family protein [Daejeonella sp. JGW-45]|uniref:penicillin acylase family protein n=1 Tax=Daejeonella sp. JGW-45 TaxID=3034148 RepID=UPI0023EC7565|nr:penicillin acylase family protein [Daejeonella sp. JGW-45]
MKIIKAILSSALALILVVSLNSKFGDIPPLGKFLDPFRGFWKNAENRKINPERNLKVDGLHGPVEIKFDERMVPHIFAGNNYDLYFAQGYVTAKDRLWQMDFQTRFASGRLSEVVGSKAIELDRYQRRMGMTYGAENMVKTMMKDPVIKEIMEAYAAGINAYIHSLKPGQYPLEYKLLNYIPEDWTPLNSALLLKLMSATLAGGSNEFYMSNILNKYGPEITRDLFPDYPFREDPIIPAGTNWDFTPGVPPKKPEVLSNNKKTYNIKTRELEDGIGSNNWAVAGAKSASGYPLLANDPHLDITLPSIWYQIQLVSPDLNTCGVSIPGSPGVIIGFNKDVAWGVTNVGADVLDWYNIEFKDATKKEYWYNNKWNEVKVRVETIEVKGGETITDSIYYTHHGPIVYTSEQRPEKFSKINNIPTGHALRWVAHDGSNDVRTFYELNKAKNYTDYRKALTHYSAPAQNFIFASVENDIAITPNGYFPMKWKGQGKFLMDGSDPANDWHGRIPAEQNPTVKNPARNFVSSANQFLTDQSYPYYINWEFAAYERGHRINKRLAVMTQANVDSMRNLQNDNYSILAENILATLVSLVNTEKLNASQREGYEIVSKWNKFFNAEEIGASIFELWHKSLAKEIWEDDLGNPKTPMRYPSRDRNVHLLLNEPNSPWFDNVHTAKKETRADAVNAAFRFAIDSLERKYGPLKKEWQWGNVKHTNVPHLAKVAGFGSKFLNNGGSKSSVNAMSENNGPSWRMIVALGKEVKAYGVFPGGASGNPGSYYYDNMVDTWSEGKLNELVYLKSKDEKRAGIISTWKLSD